jgi:hypothetical protein
MVNGSDHWFLKPSIWNKIPAARQERILEDIMEVSNIATPYALSLFDSLREEMIAIPDVESHPATDRASASELSKLSDTFSAAD